LTFSILIAYSRVKIICRAKDIITCSLTLREEHRLRVFENRAPRRIFGPKRDEVIGGLRKLHNEELHNLYSSPSIISMIKSRGMRWAGHVTRMGEERNPYRFLVGKPEGKRPLGRPRRRWEDNIRIDLKVIEWGGMDWIDMAQYRDQLRATGGFARKTQFHGVS
jgi:hypothetical protein